MTIVALEGFSDLHEISSGTLAHVYRATELPLGRTVVVKCLKPILMPDSAFAQPLEREARILAALNHPNIERLFRFIRNERTLALIVEFVDGVSLRKALDDRQLIAEEVMAIGYELARGLAHAHECGVVHADLKPANVIIGSNGIVKLVDFGIARANSLGLDEVLASRVAGPGLFGTPAYMSPEQLLSDEIDHRSDIYSLGVILYEALAGKLPIDRREARDAASRKRIEPLERVAQAAPLALCRIVMRCLEPTPAQRYRSAEQVANELGDLLSGLAIRDRSTLLAPVGRGMPPTVVSRQEQAKQPVWWRPVAALVAIFVIGVAGVTIFDRQRNAPAPAALPMTPRNAGYLRVTATPWAEVWIDGERVDVTPIGKAITLSSGMHDVTFRHPKSTDEKRRVEIRPGENVTISVAMAAVSRSGASKP